MPKHDSISLGDYDSESGEEDYAFANYDNDRLADEMDELERERDGETSTAKDAAAKTDDGKDGKTEEAAEKKPKRVMGPRVKLDPERLCGPSGLPALVKDFENIKWRPKGCEKENLQILMRKMEAWAHSMYPKARFDDTLEKIKHIGSKAKVKTCVKRLVLGLPVLPEDCVGVDSIETDAPSENTGNVAPNPRTSNNAEEEDFAWFEEMMADPGALAQAQMPSSLASATTRGRSRSLSPVVVNHYSDSNPELKGRRALNKQNINYGPKKGDFSSLIKLGEKKKPAKISIMDNFLEDDDFDEEFNAMENIPEHAFSSGMHQTAGQPAKRKFVMQEDDDDIGSQSGKLLMGVDKSGKAAQPERRRTVINEDEDDNVVSRPNHVESEDDINITIPASRRKAVIDEDDDDDDVVSPNHVHTKDDGDVAIPAGRRKDVFSEDSDDDAVSQSKLVVAEAEIDIAIPASKPKTGFFEDDDDDDDDVSSQTGKLVIVEDDDDNNVVIQPAKRKPVVTEDDDDMDKMNFDEMDALAFINAD